MNAEQKAEVAKFHSLFCFGKIVTPNRIALTEAQRHIYELHHEGMRLDEIGRHLGVTTQTIRARLAECKGKGWPINIGVTG